MIPSDRGDTGAWHAEGERPWKGSLHPVKGGTPSCTTGTRAPGMATPAKGGKCHPNAGEHQHGEDRAGEGGGGSKKQREKRKERGMAGEKGLP